MSYKYSICYPDKAEIEFRNNLISSDEVLNIAKNHPWLEHLNVMEELAENNIYYNPSLDFNSIKDGKNFAMTAHYGNNKKLEFSLWYSRPKKVKVLFGLLGEKEKISVDDVWSINFEDALKYLQHFLNGEFQKVENLFK